MPSFLEKIRPLFILVIVGISSSYPRIFFLSVPFVGETSSDETRESLPSVILSISSLSFVETPYYSLMRNKTPVSSALGLHCPPIRRRLFPPCNIPPKDDRDQLAGLFLYIDIIRRHFLDAHPYGSIP